MNFFPDFAPNSRKEWGLSLFNQFCENELENNRNFKFLKIILKIIQFYSIVSLEVPGVVDLHRDEGHIDRKRDQDCGAETWAVLSGQIDPKGREAGWHSPFNRSRNAGSLVLDCIETNVSCKYSLCNILLSTICALVCTAPDLLCMY